MREISLHSLPLGLRFRPTDEEVFNYYLMHKISGHHEQVEFISEIDICKYWSWDLPALSTIKTIDLQWFFFCPQGWNRATNTGYWSETGRDQKIESGNKLIGMKKTLVYHIGRAPQPQGRSSRWWMYEYRATSKHLDGTLPGQSPFVLCRLFRKEDEIYYLMPKDLKMQTLIELGDLLQNLTPVRRECPAIDGHGEGVKASRGHRSLAVLLRVAAVIVVFSLLGYLSLKLNYSSAY